MSSAPLGHKPPAIAPVSKGNDPAGFVPTRRSAWSWIVYDLANTIFSINILTFYFSLWVVNDWGGTDAHFTLASSLAMALMLVAAPFLGAISDAVPQRRPFLITITTTCCALTFLLGTGGLYISLALFVFANFAFQASMIFYDPLLVSVSTEENRGRIGGLGVGLGYLGSIIGIAIGAIVLAINEDGDVWVFRLTAVAFLLFALPCFFFVRERPRPQPGSFSMDDVRASVATVRDALARLRHLPRLRRFLLGHIFYADVANTAIAVMGIYATNELGFSDQEAQVVLLVGIVGAIAGGLSIGRFVDQSGPRWTLLWILAGWFVTLGLLTAIALFDLPRAFLWPGAVLAGVALGGLWTADRPFMFRLTPPEEIGMFWGIYAMVGRFAAIIGPLMWAIIVDGLGWGRPAAVASLMVVIVIAALLIRGVDDIPHGAELTRSYGRRTGRSATSDRNAVDRWSIDE